MADKKARGFVLEKNQKEIIDELTNEEAGIIFKAIFEYEESKKEPKLNKTLKIVFKQIKVKLDAYDNAYEEKCIKNKKNIEKYWNEKKGKETNTNEYDRIQSDTNEYKIKENKNKIKINKNKNKIKENKINNISSITTTNNNNNNDTIYDFVQENFGRTLGPIEYEEVSSWEDNELTRYAIRQSVLSGKCTIKYISRILDTYQRENIKTVQQAQQKEKEYLEAKKKQSKSYKTSTEKMNDVFERFLNEE